MNRQQIEAQEVDREPGQVPAAFMRLLAIVPIRPGSSSGRLVTIECHGVDERGTFAYRKSRIHRGYRWKSFKKWPDGTIFRTPIG
ncbi:hypothetical protein QZN01_20845 [Burkholderia cenocepacia]|uniref:hypothetical protein n=1 Tax=Burkholderia cenocepacia TaxID=95486 RepID=UPI002650A399|nr:hypothetical protein [Burkholderia cenocepacia]MDN7825103.1 hypothetical protein [Burkholderia cenocepacia]